MSPKKDTPSARGGSGGGGRVSRVRGGRAQDASVAKAAAKAATGKRAARTKTKAGADDTATAVDPARLMGRIRGLGASDVRVAKRESDDDVLAAAAGTRRGAAKKGSVSKAVPAGKIGTSKRPPVQAAFDPDGEF